MRLQQFRVRDFRSVRDSGWIETAELTAFIGTNESGKTNLLMPLWKFNPAGTDGAVDLLADAPRARYNEIRDAETKPKFISIIFVLTDAEALEVATLAGRPVDGLRRAMVERDLSGRATYYVTFPDDKPTRTVSTESVRALLETAHADLEKASAMKSDEALKQSALRTISALVEPLEGGSTVDAPGVAAMLAALKSVATDGAPKTSAVVPRYLRLIEDVEALHALVTAPGAGDVKAARQWIVNHLPKFVYYSNYGNLDSEIYLPHVIENLKRTDLGSTETAKARTLKVLFQFVRLSPEEVQELGRDFHDPNGRRPSAEQIAEVSRNKREREVLMTSASTELTNKFRAWWKQGEYRFRFDADGDHFRIWVSDDRRHDEIELEGRSTGLQWFLSFYLIFLVESADAHAGAILLLDEPGHSLHPLAQRDLSQFFESLSSTNQLLYTTHSPFLVDPDHLDRVKAVYVQDDGATAVSSDLRAGERDRHATKSIYPVHAALGLAVSDVLLVGAAPVVVEGPSDQLYLSAIKTLLIGAGKITPTRELVFVPSGGVRAIKAVTSVLSGRSGELPPVLVDGDASGEKLARDLRSSLYADLPARVISVGDVLGMPGAEVEDLMPAAVIEAVASRILRTDDPDADFSAVYDPTRPVVGQAEEFAAAHDIALSSPGWKVEMARQVKARLQRARVETFDGDLVAKWQALFTSFE